MSTELKDLSKFIIVTVAGFLCNPHIANDSLKRHLLVKSQIHSPAIQTLITIIYNMQCWRRIGKYITLVQQDSVCNINCTSPTKCTVSQKCKCTTKSVGNPIVITSFNISPF